MVHFNWLQTIPAVGYEYVHIATLLLSSVILLVIGFAGRLALGSGEAAVAPSGTFSLKGVIETVIEFIISMVDTVVGEHGRKYAPMFAAVFLFIFVNNVLGLVPGMTPATENLNTTIALGLFMFVAYNIEGFKEHGVSYLKQFLGPTADKILHPMNILILMMLPIELISHSVRPLSLGLRLQGNMMGDHTVLGVFLDLVPFLIPVAFYFLGLFVCFMQAFVFTMLSMVYVSMAISHDH